MREKKRLLVGCWFVGWLVGCVFDLPVAYDADVEDFVCHVDVVVV